MISSRLPRLRRLLASPTMAAATSVLAHIAVLTALPGWQIGEPMPAARSIPVTLRLAEPLAAADRPVATSTAPQARPAVHRREAPASAAPPAPTRPVAGVDSAPAVLAVHREADLARHADAAGPPVAQSSGSAPASIVGTVTPQATAPAERGGERFTTAYAAAHGPATRHSDVAYLHSPKPAYPPMARQLGLEGTVTIRVLVNRDGMPEEPRVLASSGAGVLDRAALEGVRRWRFVPAREGETPVAHWVDIPVTFRLAARD